MPKNLTSVNPPSMSELLEENRIQTQFSMNCVQIGVIQSFDPLTQLASIKIASKQVVDVDEDGTKTFQDGALILECPVVVLFGGLSVISLPVTPGDSCIVLFNDRESDQWLYHGNDTYPVTQRMHDINDAFALVGIRSLTNSIANYLADGIRLSHGNGDSQIDLKAGLIESIATLFLHNGNMQVTGDVQVGGTLNAAVVTSGNGANGSFNTVSVVNGIVTGGS